MIGTIDIEVQAKNPNMPLWPLRAYIGSPSSLRVRNVPKKIGKWEITAVRVNVVYPDTELKTAQCVLTGGVWVGTVEGSSASGSCANGYTVFADGVDENGDPVSGYVLGRGDVEILKADGTPIEDPTHFVTDDELESAISGKAEISDVTDVADDLADLSNSLSDYYVKSETSSAAEIETALNNVSVDLSEYYAKNETSSAAELNDAFGTKQDKLDGSQVSAINYGVGELATVVTYSDNTTSSYSIYGLLERTEISAEGKTVAGIKIGRGVTEIGYALFFPDKETLSSVTIPDTVTHIRNFAFNGCSSLVSVEIPDSVYDIGSNVFENCAALQTVKLNQSGQVGFGTFRNCASLQNVEIGNGVQSIGSDAFNNCDSLTDVVIPDSVKTIGSGAFTYCDNLTNVHIGNGVTRIGERAFRGCQNLAVVNIGDSILTIDESAFSGCASLSKLTIGKNVVAIKGNAFSNCIGLTEVVFNEKTSAQVEAMTSYPWGIDPAIIKTYNAASQEWVLEQLSALEARIAALEGN